MTGKISPLRPHCRVTPAARTSEIVGYPFTAISKSASASRHFRTCAAPTSPPSANEFKSPIDVIIALDLPAGQVLEIYQEFWELEDMHRLAQIYEEAKYDLHDLLSLHRIVKVQGMEKQDIINVFELVKNDKLQTLHASERSSIC